MKNSSPTSPPAPLLAVLLWFTTLLAGAVLLASYLLAFNLTRFDEALLIALACSCFAGFYSSPVLLVLPFMLRWVFAVAARVWRWIRLLAVIVCLFVTVTWCVGWAFTGGNLRTLDLEIFRFAAAYLPAALLMAIYIYRPWLFQT